MLDQYVSSKSFLLQVIDKVGDFAREKGNSPAASLLKESRL